MSNKSAKVKCAAEPISFPKRCKSAELQELDDHLQSLREKIENRAEAVSVARSAALLFVDLIARTENFSRQLDTELGFQLFVPDLTLKENLRRGHAVLSMYDRLIRMKFEAIEGIFRCLGGQKVIAIQALAGWVAQHPEAGTINSILEQQIQRIAKTLAKQSK